METQVDDIVLEPDELPSQLRHWIFADEIEGSDVYL
jgi:hypothetical protein